ncbi:MAG: 50S ribosomal protein L11 methyltransferase [Bacteroidetes bacterium]|nr:50S ribosomal protein L11 methyltransferase [Bacteroidota bacterium]
MDYIQYEFFTREEALRDFLISLLPEVGFDGFEEVPDAVRAFIPGPAVRQEEIQEILRQNGLDHISYQTAVIAQQNWNEQWEKSFHPLIIAGRVSIRAPFHKPQPAEYEVIIEPKMSFGTGHHATTALMIEQMLDIDLTDRDVVDFGSGTGVLAILAEHLGAKRIIAIDNEEWAVENCRENIGRNQVSRVEVIHADTMSVVSEQVDVMLANINRNVIMKNLESWRTFIRPAGVLVVSGILVTDTKDVTDLAVALGFTVIRQLTRDGWVSVSFHA